MSNSLLTINMITREAVRLWKNSNAFIQNIDSQYDNSYARTGAKIGTTLRIRLPNDFTVSTGQAAQIQDTAEQSITMTLATQKHVDVSFSSVDRTMSLDDFSERIVAPMVNNLAGAVAADIMGGSEGGVCNYVANVDSNGNIITPILDTYTAAKASLINNSAAQMGRKVINSPTTNGRVIGILSGLLNPSQAISEQYRTGNMVSAVGFDWLEDPTIIVHTAGTFTAGTISGAGQTGSTLVTSAITGTLNAGDIITIAGVSQVNRITKVTTGQPRQFVVTANVQSGATSIPIYPSLIPSSGGNQVQYQTVDNSPANGATISLAFPAGGTFYKNLAFQRDAITMASADLVMPERGVEEAAREVFDGISLRMVSQYNIQTDEYITRLDVLYGYLYVRPEWAVIVADAL